MAYDYERTASALSKLTASKHTDVIWNDLHDLESGLESAIQDYDSVVSNGTAKEKKAAQEVISKIKETIQTLEKLKKGGGLFDTLFELEKAFEKAFGSPEEASERGLSRRYRG